MWGNRDKSGPLTAPAPDGDVEVAMDTRATCVTSASDGDGRRHSGRAPIIAPHIEQVQPRGTDADADGQRRGRRPTPRHNHLHDS